MALYRFPPNFQNCRLENHALLRSGLPYRPYSVRFINCSIIVHDFWTKCFFSRYSETKESSTNNGTRKVIIDADPGGDDAVALLLALASKELEVVAVTCAFGNTNERNVEINVLKTLAIANRSDVCSHFFVLIFEIHLLKILFFDGRYQYMVERRNLS